MQYSVSREKAGNSIFISVTVPFRRPLMMCLRPVHDRDLITCSPAGRKPSRSTNRGSAPRIDRTDSDQSASIASPSRRPDECVDLGRVETPDSNCRPSRLRSHDAAMSAHQSRRSTRSGLGNKATASSRDESRMISIDDGMPPQTLLAVSA